MSNGIQDLQTSFRKTASRMSALACTLSLPRHKTEVMVGIDAFFDELASNSDDQGSPTIIDVQTITFTGKTEDQPLPDRSYDPAHAALQPVLFALPHDVFTIYENT